MSTQQHQGSATQSGSGSAANSAGRDVRTCSAQGSTFDHDNAVARAACSDKTSAERVQRHKESVSLRLQRIEASLSQSFRAHPHGANIGACAPKPDELRGIGAQFDACETYANERRRL